jgi:hypothetical protein
MYLPLRWFVHGHDHDDHDVDYHPEHSLIETVYAFSLVGRGFS